MHDRDRPHLTVDDDAGGGVGVAVGGEEFPELPELPEFPELPLLLLFVVELRLETLTVELVW